MLFAKLFWPCEKGKAEGLPSQAALFIGKSEEKFRDTGMATDVNRSCDPGGDPNDSGESR